MVMRESSVQEQTRTSDSLRRGKALLWVVLLLVLAGAGAAVWFFFLRNPGGSSAADLNLVPRDAAAFVTVRVADLTKTDLGKKVLETLGKNPKGPLTQLEEMTGLKPEDIERVTAVRAEVKDKDLSWVVVTTTKPYDRDKMLKAAGGGKEKEHQGKKYHATELDNIAFLFLSDKRFVMAPEKGVQRCIEQPSKPKSGPLDGVIGLATDSKNHIAAGSVVPPEAVEMAKEQMEGKPVPTTLLEAKTAFLTANVGDRVSLQVGAEMTDADKAKTAAEEVDNLLKVAKGLFAFAKPGLIEKAGKEGKAIADELDKVLTNLKAKPDGNKVVLDASVDSAILTKAIEGMVGDIGGAAERSVTQTNFKQIALGMIFHIDSNQGKTPLHAIYSPDNKPLLSWRVALLPQLDEDRLYKQIRLNEPWDSAHNKQFWDKMPKVFATPDMPANLGLTSVQVFTGPDTPFQGKMSLQYPGDIKDGSSQTLMIVEAREAVNWMEPKDIALGKQDWDNLRARLKNLGGKGATIALWDGSVQTLRPNVENKTLRALVTHAGGEIPGDW